MIEKLYNVFELYNEAVIITEGDQAIYCNYAANEIFQDDLKENNLKNIFPCSFFEMDAECFASSITYNGQNYGVVVTTFEKYKIFSILLRRPGLAEETANLLDSLSGTMRDLLSILHISTKSLSPVIENMKDPKLTYSLASLNHAYFSMARLTNNLKTFCDYDYTKAYSFSTFDLVVLCKEIIDSISYLLHEKEINLEFDHDVPKILFKGNGDKIAQLILHLLSNSIKYTPKNGSISLTLKKVRSENIILTVKDNGEGIPSHVMVNIFNRYKEPKNLADPREGVGLGLSIVQHIAELHGGNVVLESVKNVGTTVTVMLPNDAPDDVSQKDESPNINVLTNLSDVLPTKCYYPKYLD